MTTVRSVSVSVSVSVSASASASASASTTLIDCPAHRLRTFIGALSPASSTTVTGTPPRTCRSTLLLCCNDTVPSTSQSDGQAGAIRSSPSQSCASASFRLAATMPVSSSYGAAPAEPNRFPMPDGKTWYFLVMATRFASTSPARPNRAADSPS
ncbi:hypothetical protein [Kutzneria sp. 744]|uniref:hypothetical protein n=1 Tax=Kutzneria sp. (strain 744) TaxID=345341 RepID=UPI0005BBF3E5|nr:hypothetical protein [Kutzneria sp. 744]